MVLFAWFLPHTTHYLYIKMLLIFVCWFYILLLYWMYLWGIRGLLVECLGSFRYKIIPSANRDNLTSSFPVQIPFISFFCLVSLARNFSTILNKSVESGHSCLIPDFRGKGFSFFQFSMMLAIALLCWGTFLLFLVSLELLSRKDVEFCWRLFYIYWDDHVVLSFLLLICGITFNNLHMLNYLYIPQMKLTWSWCLIFLICHWFWFASILLRILTSNFIKEISL
jgi:hypothetical protein